jgi:hypothetical protein
LGRWPRSRTRRQAARRGEIRRLERFFRIFAATQCHTASLLSYLTPGGRAAFADQLRLAARQRPVAWVFAEAPGLAATMDLAAPALAGPLAQRNTFYLVGASLRGPGDRRDDRLLAVADPYLRWLAPARGSSDDFAWVG